MSKFIKTEKVIKNKTGKEIERVLNITPKGKNKLGLQEVNNLYKKLIEETDPKKFMIKIMTIDGMKTLKAYDYAEDDLKYIAEEDYYSGLPKETRDKFDYFLGVQIITRI
jgi:hypothetical protein